MQLRTDSVGRCKRCGYEGPGPRHVCRPRRHRWNSVGRTRRKLAEILTAYARSIPGGDGAPRYPGARYSPDRIHQMRLVGDVRRWEDAHSWEAFADVGTAGPTLYSYDTMTNCVRAGRVRPIGKDGEVSI